MRVKFSTRREIRRKGSESPGKGRHTQSYRDPHAVSTFQERVRSQDIS
jgi:hypothetical protein